MTSITIAEAAKLYKKGRKTLYDDARAGLITTHREKVGNRKTTLVDLSELIRAYGEPPASAENPATTQQADIILSVEVAELRAQLEGERQLRRKAESGEARAIEQAEHWRKQAEQQNLLLTDERGKAAIVAQEAREAEKQAQEAQRELEAMKSAPKRKWWRVWG